MSLIQEALRRRGEETGTPLTLRPPAAAVPPPLPEPPPPSKSVWPWLLVALVVVAAMIGFSAWWWHGKSSPAPVVAAAKVPPKTVTPPVAKPLTPPTHPPVVAVAPSAVPTNAPATNNIIAKVKATLEKTVTPERRELVMGATNPSPVVLVSLPPAPAAAPSVATPPAVPPQPRKAIRWPKLVVTGVMARSSGHGMAFVNGQMVGVGDDLQGAHVLHMTEEGVRFVYQGETNFLRVGHSTE
ncbi:MAG: hypothetical protein EPN23_03105 [Verrucomicrobia bacterium]|nr:MAG: hypothetical protein EPN23_03105 [Verrucomicrobiota bacterium]